MSSPPGRIIPGSIYKYAVLIDTGPLYAIVDTADGKHHEASACLREISKLRLPLFVSNLTIAECHRRVLHSLGIRRGLEFLTNIYDGSVNVEWVGPADDRKAREIVERYLDQDISLTDATSAALMIRLGIIKVFSYDHHFNIMGFLRIPPLDNLLV